MSRIGFNLRLISLGRMQEAIKQATSLDEITRLEKILRSGNLPENWQSGGAGAGGDAEMEEE